MDNPLLSSFKFGAPEYAAMITLFTGIFLILNYTCIKSMLPSERFYDLQNEIHWLIIYDDMSMSHQGDFKSNYIKLERKLDKLKIPYPDLPTEDDYEAREWLANLYALSATKDIRAARLLMRKS